MANYKVNQGHLTQKIGDKTTIFSGEESILHTLNEPGAYIFQGLKLGWESEKIISGLIKKFNADPIQAKNDFQDFTKQLIKKKIIIYNK